jgi:hypothetical protein
MRLTIKIGLLTLALLGAASPEEQLAWVERAAPAVFFDQDIRAGLFRFFSVCDYSCDVRGLGHLNYTRCYSTAARLQVIEGTSDVIESSRHEELQQKAFSFASQYNQLLTKRLDALGKRACPPGEDWDSLLRALSEHIWKMTPEPPTASVAASDKPIADGQDFKIHIPNASQFSHGAQSSICAIVTESGIRRRVRFFATFGDMRNPKASQRFSCEASEVAA